MFVTNTGLNRAAVAAVVAVRIASRLAGSFQDS
jgi:hypothetical protein